MKEEPVEFLEVIPPEQVRRIVFLQEIFPHVVLLVEEYILEDLLRPALLLLAKLRPGAALGGKT